jgi:hypothetical protein
MNVCTGMYDGYSSVPTIIFSWSTAVQIVIGISQRFGEQGSGNVPTVVTVTIALRSE